MIWTERLLQAASSGTFALGRRSRQLAQSEQRQRRTRIALARREAELVSVFENTIAGKFETDLATGRMIRANRVLCRMLGRTEAELRRLPDLTTIVHADDRAACVAQWAAMRRSGQGFDAERRYVRPDGRVVWGRLSVCLVGASAKGARVATAILQDITPLKEAEIALRESQDLLRLSLEIGSVNTFRLDYATGMIRRGTGEAAAEGAPLSFRSWLATLVPEDRRRLLALRRATHRERRSIIAFEYRCLHPERGLQHFETRSRVERDGAGRAVAAVGVAIDVTARRSVESRVEHLAHHDPLTNLPNRSLFHTSLDTALDRAGLGTGCAILMLDLDRFKEVNDTLGHPAGDRLLCAAAARLRAVCRKTDVVARLGGDEFAIVQFPVSGPDDATALAARAIAALTAPFDIEGHLVEIGTSIGIIVASDQGLDRDRLIRNADIALYEAKRLGRGQSRLFDPAMEEAIQQRRLLDSELRMAVGAGEMEVFYQPLVSIAHNRICGMEALVRWRNKRRGLVMPDEFIPQAEQNGVLVGIGAFVLNRACIDALSWPDDVMVAVNISASEFSSPTLVETVAGALRASGLSPHRLQLEITESTILEDTRSTTDTLEALKELGISISIDDFGTGFSSLSYLQRFPFDKVKIDRSFITPLGQSNESMAIVRAVVGLCAGLNIETTAEGVETVGQLSILSDLGCTEAQGYHFSRPRPGSEVPGFVARFYQQHDGSHGTV